MYRCCLVFRGTRVTGTRDTGQTDNPGTFRNIDLICALVAKNQCIRVLPLASKGNPNRLTKECDYQGKSLVKLEYEPILSLVLYCKSAM